MGFKEEDILFSVSQPGNYNYSFAVTKDGNLYWCTSDKDRDIPEQNVLFSHYSDNIHFDFLELMEDFKKGELKKLLK